MLLSKLEIQRNLKADLRTIDKAAAFAQMGHHFLQEVLRKIAVSAAGEQMVTQQVKNHRSLMKEGRVNSPCFTHPMCPILAARVQQTPDPSRRSASQVQIRSPRVKTVRHDNCKRGEATMDGVAVLSEVGDVSLTEKLRPILPYRVHPDG